MFQESREARSALKEAGNGAWGIVIAGAGLACAVRVCAV
jgi:hypothetical protein